MTDSQIANVTSGRSDTDKNVSVNSQSEPVTQVDAIFCYKGYLSSAFHIVSDNNTIICLANLVIRYQHNTKDRKFLLSMPVFECSWNRPEQTAAAVPQSRESQAGTYWENRTCHQQRKVSGVLHLPAQALYRGLMMFWVHAKYVSKCIVSHWINSPSEWQLFVHNTSCQRRARGEP